jgi:hypothetical protein
MDVFQPSRFTWTKMMITGTTVVQNTSKIEMGPEKMLVNLVIQTDDNQKKLETKTQRI